MARISKNWKTDIACVPHRPHPGTERRPIHRGFLERVYDSARRLGFRQKVGWSVSSRRGALHYFRDLSFGGFRRRTPGPPPFSSMNSTPAASIAARNLCVVSSRPPSSPSAASSRATVGSEIPERSAKSACDQASSALAAFSIAEARTDHQARNRTSLLSSGGSLNRRRADMRIYGIAGQL
jgi:hypothetical protein